MRAVLTVSAIPILMLLGACGANVAARLRFAHSEGAFRCKLRPAGRRWPLRSTYARWVHSVLLVQRGLFVPRTVSIGVRIPEDMVEEVSKRDVRGLGQWPVLLVLQLDDGPVLDVAAPAAARTRLVGPFLAAAIPGLPQSPPERPHRGR